MHPEVTIGQQAYVDATAEVHPSAELANGVLVWNWTKVRENAKVGERTSIGQSAYIDQGVRIGARCKIQNGVSVYAGVTIGNDVFVGPNATFTNDRIPRAHSENWQITETFVESGASIGANATIVCGVVLGRHCMVAAGATVTREVPPHALVMGCPATVVDYVTISGRRLYQNPQLGPPADSDLLDQHVSGVSAR